MSPKSENPRADAVPLEVSRDAQKCRATAVAFLAAADAVNTDPTIEDDDPRWEHFDQASRAFNSALGFGFAADPEDVAALLVELIRDPT